MSTTVVEFENQDVIVVEMSGRGPIGPRGRQGEPGPAGPSEWGVIQGNISDQTDLQAALDAKADVGASYTKSEEDALLAQKADADSVYTKTETDSLLADKADTDDVYSKTEVNTLLSGKADADTVYTKTETDALLDAKADVGDSYTKAEEDALLAVKANSADVYTKTETDTLLADKADADDVYTKTEVDDALDLKADSADVYTKDETDEMLLDKAPVILSNASGSIASFSDGSASPVTALSVAIEPVQDLHGYDNPWPAGGGKNLLKPPSSGETKSGVTFTVNSDGTITANGTASVNSDFYLVGTGSNGYAYANIPSGNYIINGNDNLDSTIGSLYIIEEGGNIVAQVTSANKNISVTLSDTTKYRIFVRIQGTRSVSNAIFKPMIRLASVTDATYAPYSNICPISGHSTATVTRTGKNLFDKNNAGIDNGYWSTDYNNLIVGSPLPNGFPSDNVHTSAPISVKPNMTYTVVGNRGNYPSFLYLDKDLNFVSGFLNESRTSLTFTVPNNPNIAYLRFPFNAASPDTCQLELGSTATAYEPYQGTSVTIDLDGTRYGGTLNVLTGEMRVTHGYADLGDYTWTYYTSGTHPVFYTGMPGGYTPEKYSSLTEAGVICSIYPNGMYAETRSILARDLPNKSFSWISANTNILIRDDSYSSASDFKTAMSGVQVVYPLKTPLTVTLSPSQMQTLLGQNNIWADTGDVAVEYRADTKLYIDSKFSQLQALILEN